MSSRYVLLLWTSLFFIVVMLFNGERRIDYEKNSHAGCLQEDDSERLPDTEPVGGRWYGMRRIDKPYERRNAAAKSRSLLGMAAAAAASRGGSASYELDPSYYESSDDTSEEDGYETYPTEEILGEPNVSYKVSRLKEKWKMKHKKKYKERPIERVEEFRMRPATGKGAPADAIFHTLLGNMQTASPPPRQNDAGDLWLDARRADPIRWGYLTDRDRQSAEHLKASAADRERVVVRWRVTRRRSATPSDVKNRRFETKNLQPLEREKNHSNTQHSDG